MLVILVFQGMVGASRRPCYTARMAEREAITSALLAWYDRAGRVLPFRGTKDPYLVWVSEIMLQQTRTDTVGRYYERFIARFPDVRALAAASESEVLKLWEGLGYYTRARNLHKAAQIIADTGFPRTAAGLQALPGIGPYTAAAVASIAFDEPVPAMDGNLQRVIARLYNVVDNAAQPSVRRLLYSLGKGLMPPDRPGDMNQALMDLGAMICLPGTPDCAGCPLADHCMAYLQGEPDMLPVLPQKKPPRRMPVGVAVVTCRGRVLMIRRREALLKGLYVFPLNEESACPDDVLRRLGVRARFVADLGAARHVFTHRVWEMTLRHYEADDMPPVPHGCWVTLDDMQSLPIPTAMKAARAAAESLLRAYTNSKH